MAGAVAELAHKALSRDFRHIDPKSARIILVEAAPRLLMTFPESLSETARRSLERLGVEVRLGKAVTAVDENGVGIGEDRIESATVIWAAGVAASPAARWLGAEKDKAGRVKVNRDMTLPGHPDVFVIGDVAAPVSDDGTVLPQVAQVAIQQGRHVGRQIERVLRGEPTEAFRYKDKGSMATIGRNAAVAQLPGGVTLTGPIGWIAWLGLHLLYLIGFRNRANVLVNWAWNYLTYDRGARLLGEDAGEPHPLDAHR
jgi:NADH dehydrogenase